MKKDIDWLAVMFTALLHLGAGLLLWLIALSVPVLEEESGVSVMLGNMGNQKNNYEFTEVFTPSVTAVASVPESAPEADMPMVTQNIEESVTIESGEKQQVKNQTVQVNQPTEAEIRAQREQEAAASANQLMSVFGRSQSVESDDSELEGVPGVPEGNSAEGKTTGTGGWGSFNLDGRSLDGSLVRPVYDTQEEGRVVVNIIVSPEGKVIGTSINNRTNTTSLKLRNAAESAARNTRFNVIGGPDNQSGTIIYYFKLK